MAEQTLIFGNENHLVGTLTPPAPGKTCGPPRCVAVLTNSGVIPRTGPHRVNVHLARRFAAMGIPSLRFDLTGLGDSLRSGSTRPMSEQWVADTRCAMDTAQSHFDCDRFVMVGFCSGAEVAHLVALEDRRLRAAVLWDLYAYPTLQSRFRAIVYRLQRAGSRGACQKILSLTGFRPCRDRSAAVSATQPSPAAQPWPVPPRDVYARRIQALVDDGVDLLFAFCGGEPEWFNYRGQFRAMFRPYGFVDRVAFDHLEKCDHLLTRREAQQAFSDMVVHWLEQHVLVARPRHGAVTRSALQSSSQT